MAHDSLIRVMSACLSARVKDDSVKNLNMILREQMLDGCDEINDIKVINSIILLDSHLKTLPLEAKMKKMQELVTGVMDKQHTCFISYTGNVLWGGMEKYIRDVHVYAGEKKRHDISVEIFTCGDHFSICFMQPGKNPAIVEELVKCMKESGITCELTSEGHFDLPDFTLPQIKEQSH